MSSQSGSGESGDGCQDLVCGFGPSKGFRLLIVDLDELPDSIFQFLDAGVRAALNLPLREQCEPSLDLVEP